MTVLIAFGILSFIALFAVYAWTDLGELMAEQMRLDELWADDLTADSTVRAYDWARDGDWAA